MQTCKNLFHKGVQSGKKTSQELRKAALRVVGCQGVEVWQNSKTQIVREKNLTRATVSIVTITTVTSFTTVTVTSVTVNTVTVTTVTITTVTIN